MVNIRNIIYDPLKLVFKFLDQREIHPQNYNES